MLSRTHWMTLDEASQILNIKKGAIVEESELQKMLKVRWAFSLFSVPSPFPAPFWPCSATFATAS